MTDTLTKKLKVAGSNPHMWIQAYLFQKKKNKEENVAIEIIHEILVAIDSTNATYAFT